MTTLRLIFLQSFIVHLAWTRSFGELYENLPGAEYDPFLAWTRSFGELFNLISKSLMKTCQEPNMILMS